MAAKLEKRKLKIIAMFPPQVIVNLPDEYYAQGYGAGYEAYTQVWFFWRKIYTFPSFIINALKWKWLGNTK